MLSKRNLLTIYDAAMHSEKQNACTSQKHAKPNKAVPSRRSNDWFMKQYLALVELQNTGGKVCLPKIPNYLVDPYIENTSEELSKKFRYKCGYTTCSEVVESYGSETKAYHEIKQHVWNHLFADYSAKSKKILQGDTSTDMYKGFSRRKTAKTISDGELNRGKLNFQKSPVKSQREENVHVPCSHHFDDEDSRNSMDTLKAGQFEHDYAKSGEELSAENSSVHEAGQNKKRSSILSVAEAKNCCSRPNCGCLLETLNYKLPSTLLLVPPFPKVLIPEHPEPAYVTEFHENGDPVEFMEPTFVQSSTTNTSPKKVDYRTSRKKAKFSRMVNAPRSVLECVDNKVTCKSNASSEQRDALVLLNSTENSENVEKNIQEIATRNIQLLSQQRKKRKGCIKPSVYICQICDKRFTANTSLSYHYLGHLKIKQFRCHICCSTFTRRHSLKYHLMIHDNKNRFECSTCNRLFRHPSHFKEHMRKHTGEEPYPCQFCSNKFKTRNSYKRHLKIQHQKHLTSSGIVPIHNDS